MTAASSRNKRSPREKFIQMMRNIVKLSSFPLQTTNVRSDTSPSLPHRDHTSVNEPKMPKDQTPKRQNNRHLDGLGGEGSSSFIKVQGINHDNGREDDVDGYKGMQTSELKTSVTNLKAADYIRRFHEKNKHESVSLVLPPPPPPPRLPQDRFLLK